MTDLNILTLNCWGLGLGISKDRNARMQYIGEYLATQQYDIICLQEVWKHENYFTIRSLLSPAMQHSHYFDNGIIGTGTCIFSRTKLKDVTFHEFALNGYPHKLAHGDWFGGKGLGVCQLEYQGFIIHVFTSHYHATYNYNPVKDVYIGHRVVHSVESAQWIKLSSSSADLTIYCGDFNTEPKDIPYQIVRYVTPLYDAWVEANGEEGGETSETPSNSYTTQAALKEDPVGKRIDYIMYKPGPCIKAEAISCTLPLPDRIPGKEYSYSDHEGVAAKLTLSREERKTTCVRDYVRSQSVKDIGRKKEVVQKGIEILEESLRTVRLTRLMYILGCLLCMAILVLTFIPFQIYLLLDIALFFVRLVLILMAAYLFFMSVLFFRKERHSIRSTIFTLQHIAAATYSDNEEEEEVEKRRELLRTTKTFSTEDLIPNGRLTLGDDEGVDTDTRITIEVDNQQILPHSAS